MLPIKRDSHNFTYKGPTEDIGDLTGEKTGTRFTSHWRPNEEELKTLNEGGDIELALHTSEPIPPVSVNAVPAE